MSSWSFTDLTSSKRRPALVISPDSFNALGQDLVLAAITSQISGAPNSVILDVRDFADGNLPKRSEVRVAKLFTIHSTLVLRRLCRLKEEKRVAVLRAVREFLVA